MVRKCKVIACRLCQYAFCGSALAQLNLGEMYQTGIGVLADNVLAQMWFNLFGANGDSNGAKKREKIAKDMTPEDISKAQAMARV